MQRRGALLFGVHLLCTGNAGQGRVQGTGGLGRYGALKRKNKIMGGNVRIPVLAHTLGYCVRQVPLQSLAQMEGVGLLVGAHRPVRSHSRFDRAVVLYTHQPLIAILRDQVFILGGSHLRVKAGDIAGDGVDNIQLLVPSAATGKQGAHQSGAQQQRKNTLTVLFHGSLQLIFLPSIIP